VRYSAQGFSVGRKVMNSKTVVETIAQRLKELRKLRGWSLDTTSKKTGVSKAMLGQIERGESSPTIGTLWKISSGLESSFSSFLSEEAEKGMPTVAFPEDPAMQIQTIFPYSSTTRIEVFEVTLFDDHEQQSSAHQLEVIEHVIVIEGSMELFFDGTWHALSAGERVRFYADQQHAYRALGSEVVFHNIISYPQAEVSTNQKTFV
jgi:transcriptional regulator with XRE-family HTH domain